MPRVKLARDWFGPDGARYRKGEHEMGDSLIKALPSSAEVIAEPKPAPKPKEETK